MPRIHIDADELRRLWHDETLSRREIGLALGVSQSTLSRIAAEMSLPPREVVAEAGAVTITGRVVEGRFPRWRDVVGDIDGEPSVLEVADLLPAVRAAAIVTSEQSKGVDLAWTSDTLVISGRSAEYGESTVKCPIVVAGETSSTKLDPRYLADFLRTIPADEEPNVDVYAKDPASRVLLRCGPYTGVIMPLAQEG